MLQPSPACHLTQGRDGPSPTSQREGMLVLTANEASPNGCLQLVVKFSHGCKGLLGYNSGVVPSTSIESA